PLTNPFHAAPWGKKKIVSAVRSTVFIPYTTGLSLLSSVVALARTRASSAAAVRSAAPAGSSASKWGWATAGVGIAGALAGAYAGREHITRGGSFLTGHVEFASALIRVSELRNRILAVYTVFFLGVNAGYGRSVEIMRQDTELMFRTFYNEVRDLLDASYETRTFIELPPSAAAEFFIKVQMDAEDEIDAHMNMFSPTFLEYPVLPWTNGAKAEPKANSAYYVLAQETIRTVVGMVERADARIVRQGSFCGAASDDTVGVGGLPQRAGTTAAAAGGRQSGASCGQFWVDKGGVAATPHRRLSRRAHLNHTAADDAAAAPAGTQDGQQQQRGVSAAEVAFGPYFAELDASFRTLAANVDRLCSLGDALGEFNASFSALLAGMHFGNAAVEFPQPDASACVVVGRGRRGAAKRGGEVSPFGGEFGRGERRAGGALLSDPVFGRRGAASRESRAARSQGAYNPAAVSDHAACFVGPAPREPPLIMLTGRVDPLPSLQNGNAKRRNLAFVKKIVDALPLKYRDNPHRQVIESVLKALREAPDGLYVSKARVFCDFFLNPLRTSGKFLLIRGARAVVGGVVDDLIFSEYCAALNPLLPLSTAQTSYMQDVDKLTGNDVPKTRCTEYLNALVAVTRTPLKITESPRPAITRDMFAFDGGGLLATRLCHKLCSTFHDRNTATMPERGWQAQQRTGKQGSSSPEQPGRFFGGSARSPAFEYPSSRTDNRLGNPF
ncbi:MAG: hypothetical protein BJ554DRAFT_6151, partial [Olpidium bornovanus]